MNFDPGQDCRPCDCTSRNLNKTSVREKRRCTVYLPIGWVFSELFDDISLVLNVRRLCVVVDSRNSAAKVCDSVISSWCWHLTGRTRQVCALDARLSCCTKIFCVNHKNVSSVFSLTDCAMENHSAISRQNNLELHLRCHTCWLSYFTLICLLCGRTYGYVIAKISRRVDNHNFLGMGQSGRVKLRFYIFILLNGLEIPKQRPVTHL